MKKRWLIPLALVLVLAIGTLGASAYFSSEAQVVDNVFHSGTLVLTLSDFDENGLNVIHGTWVTPENWAPGQTVNARVYLNNTGNIDAQIVDANWILSGDTMLADKIIITQFSDSTGGPMGVVNWTLAHLASLSSTVDGWFSNVSGPFIPAGSVGNVWFDMTFQFDPTADNTYQGKNMGMAIVLTAQQINTH